MDDDLPMEGDAEGAAKGAAPVVETPTPKLPNA